MLSNRSASKSRTKSLSRASDDANETFLTDEKPSSPLDTSYGLLTIPRVHVQPSAASNVDCSPSSPTTPDRNGLVPLESETRKSSVSSNNSIASANSGHNVTPVSKSQRPSRSEEPALFNSGNKNNRKFWGELTGDDCIYNIYLKKIMYSNHNELTKKLNGLLVISTNDESQTRSSFGKDVFRRKSVGKSPKKKPIAEVEKAADRDPDEVDLPNSVLIKQESQSLLWETRQIRVLKGGTLEHILNYILLATQHQIDQQNGVEMNGRTSHCNAAVIEEERNNVAHVMHVLFCCYRTVSGPLELFKSLHHLTTKSIEAQKQFSYVLHYWLNNYPDDFFVPLPEVSSDGSSLSSAPYSSSSGSSQSESGTPNQRRVIDLLLETNIIDDALFKRAAKLSQEFKVENLDPNGNVTYSKGSSSCILELDARFVAQQLTAIDLQHFLSLKAHTLLENVRSNPKVQSTIKNFNLLSRHVIVTILKAQSPDIVTAHWIEIASQLRRMKNFNSLKAVISGLTNESVYRLKNMVWTRLNRQTINNFKWLSAIVDDVNNQTLLRQTQLEIEGTAKVSLQEESFGTIPYLGTFLTDLTVIDSQFNSTLSLSNGAKLINVEKWSKQFEILTQIQLLQKNVRAALTAVHQSQNLSGLSQLPTQNSTPVVPRVARLFRNWFQDNNITTLNDNDCYKLSLALEPPPIKK
ncbi:Ral guanine nucleotide dissociation stimulator [Halotydeus destructor]|nr:Ral guanine nucleotide dissociation stimulator [Halotydeus destructor]